jgi:hypothetical protein
MSEAPTSPTAPATAPNFFEDIVDIWYAPSAVFARRAKSGFFAMMMLITIGIGGLLFANRGVMQSIMDGEWRRQTAEMTRQNPSITQEQMTQMRQFGEMAQSIGIFVIMPVLLLVLGLCTFLTSKILGASEFGFGAAMMVACWSYLPKLLETIGVGIQGMVLDTDAMTGRFQLSLGVGRFMDPDSSAGLLALLGRVDIFTIWVSVLIGIGICVVGKLPRTKIVPAAVIMWLFGALPALWQLSRS